MDGECSNVSNITDSSEKMEQELEQAVHELVSFAELYIERNGIESSGRREEDVNSEVNKVLKLIDDKQICCRRKSHVFLCKGRALNILPGFSSEAVEALTKAVRLEPRSVSSWNELGECYARKGEYDEAIRCYSHALERETNKVSLRRLSQTLRQVGRRGEERAQAIAESVERAKAAVACDVEDGTSWECLGTAYLVLFFSSFPSKSQLLKQSNQAYTQAKNHGVSRHHPDLWYNCGFIHLFEEDYDAAIHHFKHSHALDPGFDLPIVKVKDTCGYLRQVDAMVRTKGKVRTKKLHQYQDSLKAPCLGPYASGVYKSSNGLEAKLTLVKLDDLTCGLNSEVVVLGKVIGCIPGEMVPFTFCMIDSQSSCVSVTVYNMAQGHGVIIGDSVAIPDPYLGDVQVVLDDGKEVKYRNIRVHLPLVMVVNGKKFGKEKMAYTQWKVDHFQYS